MNKAILICLIAVCVATSVQAFVRRDAPVTPSTEENYFEKLKDVMDQFGNKIQNAFNPEDIGKQFNEVIGALSKSIDGLKKNMESKPVEAKP